MGTKILSKRHMNHTRIERQCAWCDTCIDKGMPYVRIATVESLYGFTLILLHPECHKASLRDPCNDNEYGCIYVHQQGMTCDEVDEEPEVRYP